MIGEANKDICAGSSAVNRSIQQDEQILRYLPASEADATKTGMDIPGHNGEGAKEGVVSKEWEDWDKEMRSERTETEGGARGRQNVPPTTGDRHAEQ